MQEVEHSAVRVPRRGGEPHVAADHVGELADLPCVDAALEAPGSASWSIGTQRITTPATSSGAATRPQPAVASNA